MTKKRVEASDPDAIVLLANYYYGGECGLPQDQGKAIELWLRAGELGHADSYYNVGVAYDSGAGVEWDEKKAKHYYELAAMGGSSTARHNLGCSEYNAGNANRAVKHWMIAAGAGLDVSLEQIRECFLKGYATKSDFEKALRAHKEAKDETKSDLREAAAAAIQEGRLRMR